MALKLNNLLAMVCRTGCSVALVGAVGCAKLTSSASLAGSASLVSSSVSSEIISSPFRSSSRSSAQEEEQEQEQEERQIQEEIEIYTAFWLRADNLDTRTLLVQVSQLLAWRGISDWQARDAVWRGMGRALALSDRAAESAEDYVRLWSGGKPEYANALLLAYCSARTAPPAQQPGVEIDSPRGRACSDPRT